MLKFFGSRDVDPETGECDEYIKYGATQGTQDDGVPAAVDASSKMDDNKNDEKGIFQGLDPSNDAPMPNLSSQEERAHATLKSIQYWMDQSIKFCGKELGLDPILGVMPVVGDFGSALISLFFVARASPVLSRYTIARMLTNVGVDAVVGTVPLLGDVFDVSWKANQRNMAIFENHMKVGREIQRDADRLWVIKIVIACMLVYAFASILTLVVVVFLVLHFTGSL